MIPVLYKIFRLPTTPVFATLQCPSQNNMQLTKKKTVTHTEKLRDKFMNTKTREDNPLGRAIALVTVSLMASRHSK